MLESVSGIKNFCFIQRLVFRGLSIDITGVEYKIHRPFCIWFTFVCQIIFFLGVSQSGWENRDDLNDFMASLAVDLEALVCVIKFLTIIVKRKDMFKLMHNIWILTIEANTDELSIIAEENAKDFVFGLCYYVMIFAVSFLSTIVPLLMTIAIYVKTGKLQNFQVIKTSYPFDENQPILYFIGFGFVLGGFYFAGHISVAMDTLYSFLILNTAAQFRVLRLKLKKAALGHQHSEMDYAIYRCIKHYQRILNIADELDVFFRMIVFAEVIINCVQFGVLAYQLGHSSGMNLENLAYLITFFGAASARLTIYCYGGQRIQDEVARTNYSYISLLWSLEKN